MHTYMHTYIHACIHTCIHTHINLHVFIRDRDRDRGSTGSPILAKSLDNCHTLTLTLSLFIKIVRQTKNSQSA